MVKLTVAFFTTALLMNLKVNENKKEEEKKTTENESL
jgi:preprotein translocase subunit SecG